MFLGRVFKKEEEEGAFYVLLKMELNSLILRLLRVQNEPFSEEKGFILLYRKGSIVSAGIRSPDPWITQRTLYH